MINKMLKNLSIGNTSLPLADLIARIAKKTTIIAEKQQLEYIKMANKPPK